MYFWSRPASRGYRLLTAFAVFLVVGCLQSADQALDKSLAAAGQHRTTVYPLAGKLTVDGLPPERESRERIIVMLNDPAKLDKPLSLRPHASVDTNGEFAFQTYVPSDGVEPGTYIVTFAKLAKKRDGFVGPDGFHNLYNDPEKNQEEYPELKIDHQPPGKKNYEFKLQIAGRDPVEPSSKSLTKIGNRGK